MFRRVSYLGAEEVRDMRFVPPQQLAAFPKRTAGQVKALEQRASTRVRWTIEPGADAYFSFVPLGTTDGCVCTYRVGIREAPDKLKELHRVDAEIFINGFFIFHPINRSTDNGRGTRNHHPGRHLCQKQRQEAAGCQNNQQHPADLAALVRQVVHLSPG